MMFKHYLQTALRSLQKRKGYAFINILGLAIGITASLLILRYVTYELSYDTFHEGGERIYRVQFDYFVEGERVLNEARTFPGVGPAMREDFPEVETYARLYPRRGGGVVRYEDQTHKEDLVFQADPAFLTLFSYSWLRGDRRTALTEPGAAVISEEAARRLFGHEDPIGKQIRFGADEEYRITGLIQSPENSHLKFNFLFSYATLAQKWGDWFEHSWGPYDFYTYLLLHPDADPKVLEARFPAFIARHRTEEVGPDNTIFSLQPVVAIHLHADLGGEARVGGNATTVYSLAVIALLILVMAWVNYVNLATAQATTRAREVGVRKVVGAQKKHLLRQFMLESLLLNGVAVLVALVLFKLALPAFADLVGLPLSLGLTGASGFWQALIGLFCAGVFLSGLYPAFVWSSYQPLAVLKGTFTQARRGLQLRELLIVAQFIASVGLVAGTLIVYEQLVYMRSQDLGIDIDQTLVVEGPEVMQSDSLYASQWSGFKQAVSQYARVQRVTASTDIPGNQINWTNPARKLTDTPEAITVLYEIGIDYDYLDAYGLELLAGRGYAPSFTADDRSVLLNETALRVLGLPDPEGAIGERVIIGEDTLGIVGVVADFHYEGLQKNYNPMALLLRPSASSYYALKVSPENLARTISYVEQQFKAFFPGNPFAYFFLDAFFDRQYRAHAQLGRVVRFFALLAVLVACLGLFGLASFTAAQRAKEIGVRKVLGSTVPGIVALLSKQYLKLVLLSSGIATPVVWLLMRQWLDGFAFRIDLRIWPFASAAALTLVVALLAVSYQSIKAALANPVHALRYE